MSSPVLSAVLAALLAGAIAAFRAPADPDMWWHLASGDWMIDHGRLLDRDVFSYTRAGTPYAAGQWLGQVALAGAYRAAGWVGIDLLRAAWVALSAFFVARATLRVQPHVGWAAPAIAGVLLVSSTTWGDRPQLATLAFFPLVLDVLLAARIEGRTRRLAVLPPLFLLWANLHGGFVAGLVAVAIVAAESLPARSAAARPLAAAFALSLAASLVNPAAFGAVGWAASYASTSAPFVVEERALDIRSGAGVVFAALLFGAFAAATMLGPERLAARAGPPLMWVALAVPFGFLGLAIQRQLPLACAVLAPLVAAAVPAALGRPRAIPPPIPRAAATATALALALAAVAASVVAAPRAPDLAAYPAGALTSLGTARGNLLNEYDWGGYLIREAPAQPTFIDGRGALLFVPQVLDDFRRAVGVLPGYEDTLRRWDIAVVLLRPERPLVTVLRQQGWRVLAEERGRWTLLARP